MLDVEIGGCDTVLIGQTCLGRAEHVVEEKSTESLVGNLNERYVGRPSSRRLNVLKLILLKYDGKEWTGLM
jgi:hypothetical protein